MKTDLLQPCAKCPFVVDLHLRPARREEIANSLLAGNSFACHKTVEWEEDDDGELFHNSADEQHCAGAMVMLERMRRPNQWMRWMERLGFYDHTKLDGSKVPWEDLQQWIDEGGS